MAGLLDKTTGGGRGMLCSGPAHRLRA